MKLRKQKNSSQLLSNIRSFSFFIVFLLFAETVDSSNKFKITSYSYERMESYFTKNLYSYVYGNKLNNITSLAFAISKDGENTVLGYCRENIKSLCQTNSPYLFQTKKRCERKFKKKCQILLKDNFLLMDNKKILINNKNQLSKYFAIFDNKIVSSKDKHTDFEVPSSREIEGCGETDC